MDLKTDSDGHLLDPAHWSPRVAEALADAAGIPLTEDHWRILEALRAFHRETGVAPSMRPLVKLVRERVDPRLASSIALLRLFPRDPARIAARIAGLPKPDKCL